MERFDVTVVGAGLAGLRLARLLAERGHSVALLDRKKTLDQRIHTTGIFVRRTLEDFGEALPADCLGAAVQSVRLYSPRRRMIEFHSRHVEFRIGRMGRLYQRLLTQAVDAGVVWRNDTEFSAVQNATPDRLTVAFQDSTGTASLETRFLVGADGASSRVSKALGLSDNRDWIVGLEDIYHAPADGPPTLHCFLDPQLAPGYIAWVASDCEETHVGLGGYAHRMEPKRSLAAFTASIADMFGLRRNQCVETRGGRIPVGGILPRIINRHGLLVGDAAGAVSPLTAGGLDPCFRQSELAATVINRFLRSGDPRALYEYSSSGLRGRFAIKCWMRRGLAALRTPWAAEVLFGMLRVPPFQQLARYVFFGRESFPLAANAATARAPVPASLT